MELWIPITIAAAFFQNIRSGLQKHLRNRMGTAAATFVRFGYGVPFACVFLSLSLLWTDAQLPKLTPGFWVWLPVAAICQIVGQVLLIIMFTMRNFAVGGAYVRTEPVMATAFGLVILAELPGLMVFVAVIISVIGVMMISLTDKAITLRSLVSSLRSQAALIGLSSAVFFALAAVAYRAASLSLGGPNFLVQGAVTLVAAICLQSVILVVWIAWNQPAEFAKLTAAWRPGLAVGFVGALASFGWFTAMTLEQAALVKAVAQVEMLFAIATTVLVFREHISRREIVGCGLIVAGVLIVILLG